MKYPLLLTQGNRADAFLALKQDGTGICWGNARYGGSCKHVNFTGVTLVQANHAPEMADYFVRSQIGYSQESKPVELIEDIRHGHGKIFR